MLVYFDLFEISEYYYCFIRNIVADLSLHDFVEILFCLSFPSPIGSEAFDSSPVCRRPHSADVCLDMILQFLEKEEDSPAKQAQILEDIIELGRQNFPIRTMAGCGCIVPWGRISIRAQTIFIDKLHFLFSKAVRVETSQNICFYEKEVMMLPLDLLEKNVKLSLKEGHEIENEDDEFSEVPAAHIFHYYSKHTISCKHEQQGLQIGSPVDYCIGVSPNNEPDMLHVQSLAPELRYVKILGGWPGVDTDKLLCLNVFLGVPQDDSFTDLIGSIPRPTMSNDETDFKTLQYYKSIEIMPLASKTGLISWHPKHLKPKQPSSDNSVHRRLLHNRNIALDTQHIAPSTEEDVSWKSRNIFQDAFEKALYPVNFCYESDVCLLFNYCCSLVVYPKGVTLQLWKELVGEHHADLYKQDQMLITMRRKMFFKNLQTPNDRMDFSNDVRLMTFSLGTNQTGVLDNVVPWTFEWDGVVQTGWDGWIPGTS